MFRALSGPAVSNRGTYNLQQKEKYRNKECSSSHAEQLTYYKNRYIDSELVYSCKQ